MTTSVDRGRWLRPQIYVVGGKGGVGKTTVSLALAKMFADQGERVLWLEAVEIPRLGHFFPGRTNRFEITHITEALAALNHNHIEALQEYLHIVFKVKWLTKRISDNELFTAVSQALPGVESLVMLGKILYEAERTRRGAPVWTKIVVDSPATGHGKQLLQFPQAAADIVKFGPVYDTAQKVDKWARDPSRWLNVSVALPEALPVLETLQMQQWMQHELGYRTALTVLNKVIDVRGDGASEADATEGIAQRRDWISGWQQIQAEHTQQLADGVDGDLIRLPITGPQLPEADRLQLVADQLAAQLLGADDE